MVKSDGLEAITINKVTDKDQLDVFSYPTTAGTVSTGIPTVSTAKQLKDSESTFDTSASTIGSNTSIYKKKGVDLHIEGGLEDISQGGANYEHHQTSAELQLNKDSLEASISNLKDQYGKETAKTGTFLQIDRLIEEMRQKSPLESNPRLDFKEIFEKLEQYTFEYQTEISALAEVLQDLDETRNQWLEIPYISDTASSSENFSHLQAIIDEHETYIETANRDFLESLQSIEAILRL